MIAETIKDLLRNVCKGLDLEIGAIILEHPSDISNGDYSTNVALAYAKQAGMNPRELAEKIIIELNSSRNGSIRDIQLAGPGFINFYLSREFFTNATNEILDAESEWGKNTALSGKKIMVEYTDPNPFKPFHIGHLMTNAIGESLGRIVEFSGAKTIRANYQGDVGPHVAKAMYGMYKAGPPPDESAAPSIIAQYIGECYAKGSDAYDNDPDAKKEIDNFNKKIYDRSDAMVNQVYDWGRKATLDAFEEIYALLGTKFDYYFFESEMAPIGQKIVRENVPNVFEKSEESEAIVFHGEKYDPKLHTRVFINSQGLSTYETKEVGLTMTKFEKENPDLSIVITAVEQAEYMKVVEKAISLIHPEYAERMKHITHGMMRLASGKMSSRKGNVVTGESLIRDSMDMVREKVAERELTVEEKEEIAKVVGVAALKYSILRSSIGGDIVYDFEKSISFEGDSGPYLQYTAIRAKSILQKAKTANLQFTTDNLQSPEEISALERALYLFPEVVAHAHQELEPHHVATYLTLLASAFNSFYANTRILDGDPEYISYYLALIQAFHTTMQNGLYLLGISLPEKM